MNHAGENADIEVAAHMVRWERTTCIVRKRGSGVK